MKAIILAANDNTGLRPLNLRKPSALVIIKPKGKKHHRKEQYGAYLVVITNYNKDELYASTRELVYGEATRARAFTHLKTNWPTFSAKPSRAYPII
jgi:hypothetical protein